MEKFKYILFGANIICLINVIANIVKNEANQLTYIALILLIGYFILELPIMIIDLFNKK